MKFSMELKGYGNVPNTDIVLDPAEDKSFVNVSFNYLETRVDKEQLRRFRDALSIVLADMEEV